MTTHRLSLVVVCAAVALGGGASPGPTALDRRIEGVLERTPLIDGHNDLLIHFVAPDGKSFSPPESYDLARRTSGQVDLARLRAGRVGAAIFTVAILDPEAPEAGIVASTSLFRELAARHPDDLEVVTDSSGILDAFAARRTAVLLGLEGGDQIGTSLDALEAIHRHGVRAMTLVWDETNEIGDSNAGAPRHDGLSPFGAEVVRSMNRLGMLVDLSHAADSTALDVIAISAAPVLLSHSSARAICPAPRNASDELLRKVAATGGIVMVTFVPYFTTAEYWSWYERGETHWAELERIHEGDRTLVSRAMDAWDAQNPPPAVTISDVADHVDHVRRVAGSDHVGLGSDFDGMGQFRVHGLEDASTFPALLGELAARGWTDTDLTKLVGGNFLRVLRTVESVAARPSGS